MVFLPLIFLLLPCEAFAGNWMDAVVKDGGAVLWREPKGSSAALGKYAAGTKVKIYTPDTSGYFALYFSKPWKGVQYGWISANELEMTAKPNSGRRNPSSSVRDNDHENDTNWIRLGLGGAVFNPSELQVILGDQSASFFSTVFELEYTRRIFPSVTASARAGMFSFSQPVTSASNAAITYFANGYTFTLGAGYLVVEEHRLSVQVGAGLGMGFSNAGNTTSTKQITTSSIMSFPFYLEALGTYRFYSGFSGYLRVGYQLHSLGAIPTLLLPLGTTQGTPNVSLSAPFVSFGVGFQF